MSCTGRQSSESRRPSPHANPRTNIEDEDVDEEDIRVLVTQMVGMRPCGAQMSEVEKGPRSSLDAVQPDNNAQLDDKTRPDDKVQGCPHRNPPYGYARLPGAKTNRIITSSLARALCS